jgi:hypothetical protein
MPTCQKSAEIQNVGKSVPEQGLTHPLENSWDFTLATAHVQICLNLKRTVSPVVNKFYGHSGDRTDGNGCESPA